VELILGQVDCLSLTVVRFVSTTWMRMVSPPPLRQHPRLDGEVLEQQELGEEEESYSKQVAAKGWLGLLQWARANGCPWTKTTCAKAAEGGHLDVLRWARANGCPWDHSTCAEAAKGGHLEALQWARANGCPWGEWTCAYAAEGGHLDVLRWARANGCPWDE
jgi:hypothetical protein